MIFINLLAGIALISFGVRFLRKGLDRFLGGRLIEMMRKATGSRISSLTAGIAAGTLAPSSTGLALLTSQILTDKSVKAANVLALLLGGNIGITFLAHLVSFNLKDFAGAFLFLGVLGFQYSKRAKVRGIGQCLLALGFIVLSMRFIGEGASGMIANHDLTIVFGMLNSHPLLLVVMVAILAVLLQSSTATIGLGIGLADGGVLDNSSLLPWVFGTNIGLGITSLIVCWGTVEGRRLGWANLLLKSLLACGLGLLAASGLKSTLPAAHLLPIWHTLFNVLAAVIALPILSGVLRTSETLFASEGKKGKKMEPLPRETYLDPQALSESPSIALTHATRECLRMADEVRLMLQHLFLARKNNSPARIRKVKVEDDRIDKFDREIILYLSQIGDDLNDYDRNWQIELLNFANELETVGDVIEKTLCDAILKQLAEKITLPRDQEELIQMLFGAAIRRIDLAGSLITNRRTEHAKALVAEQNKLDALSHAATHRHFELIRQVDKRALYSSLCFLDIMDALLRINSHISSVGLVFIRLNSKQTDIKPPVQFPAITSSGILPIGNH
jgi:phosphate:Na+ symporter